MISNVRDAFAQIVGEIEECLGQVRAESVDQALYQISKARRVFLAGAGRSGMGVRGFAMRLMHLGKEAHLVGETTTPPISTEDCLIIGSGSGATPSLLAAAGKARQIGARIVLFTIDPNSPLAQLADNIVVIPAPSQGAASHLPRSIHPADGLSF